MTDPTRKPPPALARLPEAPKTPESPPAIAAAGPNDQKLHDEIAARNREVSNASYSYDFMQRYSRIGLTHAPTHKGLRFSAEGGFDDALTRGGGRIGVGYTLPITKELVFSSDLGLGGAYNGSEAIERVTVEGSFRSELAYVPNEKWRFAVNGKIVGRATFGLDIDKAEYAVKDLDVRAKIIGARVEALIASFRTTFGNRLAALGPTARAAISAELERLASQLPGAVMNAILNPAARGAIATLISSTAQSIQDAIGETAADFIRDMSAAADRLIDSVTALIDAEMKRIEEGFEDASLTGSLHARIGIDASARLPLWESNSGQQGGGLYFTPALSAYAEIPIIASDERELIPGDKASGRYRMGVRSQLELELRIPHSTLGIGFGAGIDASLSKKLTGDGETPEPFKADPIGLFGTAGLKARF